MSNSKLQVVHCPWLLPYLSMTVLKYPNLTSMHNCNIKLTSGKYLMREDVRLCVAGYFREVILTDSTQQVNILSNQTNNNKPSELLVSKSELLEYPILSEFTLTSISEQKILNY